MEISKAQEKGLKLYLINISDGLITDVDIFVNYNNPFIELNVMVDVNWDKLPKERAYNYNLYLKETYSDEVRTFLTMVGVPFRGKIEFDILNWG
jgi:hypothetical protein